MSVQIQRGITQRIYTTVQISRGITQAITHPEVQVRRWIKQSIYATAQIIRGITQAIFIPSVQISRGITQRVYTGALISRGITQQVYVPIESTLWRSRVFLDGVDYSARLIGSVRVTHSKNASGLAEFSILPSPGVFDPLAWVGQVVVIEDVIVAPDGNDAWYKGIYTGQVAVPSHNVDEGTVSFVCTTNLQARQDAIPQDKIPAQIPGSWWSEHVFSEGESGWRYTEDRLSTVQSAMWVDRFGRTRVTDTETKATPDLTITNADRLAGSVNITRAEKSSLVNHVRIDMDFRFARFKQRNLSQRWELGKSICQYVKNMHPLPTKAMIQAAVEGSDWDQQGGIRFTDAWPPGLYECGRSESTGSMNLFFWGWKGASNGVHYTRPEEDTGREHAANLPGTIDYTGIAQLCIGASFSLSKRWAQTVTETYTMHVKSPLSITANGERAIDEGYGIEAESDDTGFESDKTYRIGITASGNTTAPGTPSGSLSVMPDGAVQLSNGDYLYEATESESSGRTALENAQKTAMHKANTTIKNSHRGNRMNCVVPMMAGLDLDQSMRIETDDDAGEGRAVELVHERNIQTGSALDTIEIAVLQVGATGLDPATPLDPPEAPESEPLTEPTSGTLSTGWSSTHIGGSVTSPPYDPNWSGYVANMDYDSADTTPLATDPNDPQAEVYPEGFYINTPEIGDADRQAIEAQAEETYTVELIEDELTEAA